MSAAASSAPDCDAPDDSIPVREAPRLRVRFVVEGGELLVLGTTVLLLFYRIEAPSLVEEVKRLTL
jgi:hypothetical protein